MVDWLGGGFTKAKVSSCCRLSDHRSDQIGSQRHPNRFQANMTDCWSDEISPICAARRDGFMCEIDRKTLLGQLASGKPDSVKEWGLSF
jgi:hypothetical protein